MLRERAPEVGPPLLDLIDHGAFHERREASADSLDFG